MTVALVLSYWQPVAESKSSFSLFYDERADLEKGTDLEMLMEWVEEEFEKENKSQNNLITCEEKLDVTIHQVKLDHVVGRAKDAKETSGCKLLLPKAMSMTLLSK